MNYAATARHIETAQQYLPEKSQGWQARNPEALARYFHDQDFNRETYPHIALVDFRDEQRPLWWYICDRAYQRGLLMPRRRTRFEQMVSSMHLEGRVLRFIELLTTAGTHHFLEEPTNFEQQRLHQ